MSATNLYAVADTGCWIWHGSMDRSSGYARYKSQWAHRVIYTEHRGPIPAGMTLDHLCRVRNCVNPEHMEAVTLRDNILRGNNPAAIYARRTHCKHGHEFTPENTRTITYGGRSPSRMCLTCYAVRNQASRKVAS